MEVYISMSGGTWLSESKQLMEALIMGYEHVRAPDESPAKRKPIHCVVGGSGYRVGNWPKEGLFCPECLSFVVKGIRATGCGAHGQEGVGT
jgi:hypothetical protein